MIRENHPRPVEVAEIYAEVERSVNFDEGDLTPPMLHGERVSEPSWRRNTRNALQSDKNNLQLVNTESGKWRLPTPLPAARALDVALETARVFESAHESVASGLPLDARPAAIFVQSVDTDGITLRSHGKETTKLESREIVRGIEMLNLAGGRLGKGTILKNGVKEAAFVSLQPRLCWSDEGRWIEIEGESAGVHLELSRIDHAGEAAEKQSEFVPQSGNDARKRVARSIAVRRGQPKFRRALLDAYGSKCCITRCDAPEALEAAHILPYRGDETNHVQNGLLMRADIHTLFDLGLIAVTPELKVAVSRSLRGTV